MTYQQVLKQLKSGIKDNIPLILVNYTALKQSGQLRTGGVEKFIHHDRPDWCWAVNSTPQSSHD